MSSKLKKAVSPNIALFLTENYRKHVFPIFSAEKIGHRICVYNCSWAVAQTHLQQKKRRFNRLVVPSLFFLMKYFANAKREIILFENCEIFVLSPECEMK